MAGVGMGLLLKSPCSLAAKAGEADSDSTDRSAEAEPNQSSVDK